jgi:hypothetical protein
MDVGLVIPSRISPKLELPGQNQQAIVSGSLALALMQAIHANLTAIEQVSHVRYFPISAIG